MNYKINKKNVSIILAGLILIITLIVYATTSLINLLNPPPKSKATTKKNSITNIEYYLLANENRYKDYQKKHPNLTDEDVVTRVNMNLDYNFYEYIITQSNPNDTNTLVNKYYQLDSNYTPNDLVLINDAYSDNSDPSYEYRNQLASKKLYDDFSALRNECKKNGINLYVVSGYRSTATQQNSYQHMANTFSVERADKTCSRPGHSEHTLGLACDIALDQYSFENITTHPSYQWFVNILPNYGFIIRYPDGKNEFTGYDYEPWHIRYLGKELAKEVINSNLTYDEYYARNFILDK